MLDIKEINKHLRDIHKILSGDDKIPSTFEIYLNEKERIMKNKIRYKKTVDINKYYSLLDCI